MNNKLLTGIITAGIILATAASAYAFSPKNFDAIKTAIKNNDYASWVTAMADTPNHQEILTKINASNFGQLVQAENLMQSGDKTQAKTILDQLGISGLFGERMGEKIDNTQIKAMETALDNNDYQAWKTAVTNLPNNTDLLSKINENNFPRLVEAHNLQKQSQTIMEELGVKGPEFGGFRDHGPQNKNNPNNQTNTDTTNN